MKPTQTFLVILLATLFTLLAPPRVFAASKAWTGNTDGNFSTGANWDGAAPATADTLTFGAAGTAGTSLTADQTAGIVYNTMTFNGAGAFTIGGANGFVLGTTTAATSLTVSGVGAQIINSPFSLGNNVQTFSLSGANLTLGGTITAAGTASALTVGGTKSLTLNGPVTLGTTSGNILVGTTASTDKSVLNIANNINAFDLRVGGNATAGSCGAVYQTGGAVSLSDTVTGSAPNSPDRIFSLGANSAGGNAGYGYYSISGNSSVTLSAKQFSIGARATGAQGVMDVAGGVATATEKIGIGRGNTLTTAAYGVLNVTGGSVIFANNIATTMEVGYTAGGFGIVNVNGGNITQGQGSSSAGGVDLGTQTQTSMGMLNLNSGTLTVGRILATATTPTALVNFNGGTLKATAVNFGANFMTSANIDAVTVYSGGGTIDNNGTSITIGKALIAPAAASSVGVTGVTGLSGGSGYIGAPIVQFTGGTALNGKVAAGYAVLSGGAISSIVITSPGDYSAAPTGVTFLGGGGTGAAVTGISSTANTSGAMNFQGSGTTTLSGANTYAGGTTVSAGALIVNSGLGSGAVTVSGSSSVLGGSGTISGNTTINGSAALTPRPSAGSATTLNFGGNLTLDHASANFTLSGSASGSNDKVQVASQLTVDSTVTFNITGGGDLLNDYTLITCGSLSTGAGGTPVLYVNGVLQDQVSVGSYQLLVSASSVTLHYLPSVLPVLGSATFSPAAQHRSGSSVLTVLVTPVADATISSVSVSTNNIGGSGDPVTLTRTDANGPGLQETWVGTFNVEVSKAAGSYSVSGTITQSDSQTISYSASLTVYTSATLTANDALNNSSFNSSGNWSDGLAPAAGNDYFTGPYTLRTPTAAGTYTFAGASISVDAGANGRFLGKVQGDSTITANWILNGGYFDQANAIDSVVLTVAGSITVNAASAVGATGVSSGNGTFETLDITAPISGSAPLQVSGPNTANWPALSGDTGLVKLSAANPYSGTITVAHPSIASAINRGLQLNNLDALRSATLNLNSSVANPVSFASGVNTGDFNVGALSGINTLMLADTAGGAVSLSVGGNNASTAYTGPFTGNGSLIKVGTGTLTLSGASTFTGNTTINAGKLALTGTGSISGSTNIIVAGGAEFDVSGLSSTFTLGSSQTLSGNGTITGAVTANGSITPGASIGTLTFGAPPTLGGTFVAELNRTNAQSADKIVFNGGATFGGTLTVTNVGPALVNGDTFDLFDGSLSGSFTTLNLPGGAGHWNTSDLNGGGSIVFTNASPVASNITIGVALGETATLLVIGGKNTPTDADGDSMTITGASAASSGTSSFDTTHVTYVANGALGTNTFSYTVTDALGATDTKTVTVIVYSPEGFNRLSPPSVIDAGTVTFSYLGMPGYTYALDWATNITPPITWIAVQTNAAATNGYLNFTNTSSEPVNFFRTRYLP